MASNLKDKELDKVSGGYKAFDINELYYGIVLRETRLDDMSIESFYLIVSNIDKNGYFSCKKWVIKTTGEILVNGVDTNIYLDGSNVIYTIEPNPPECVHI